MRAILALAIFAACGSGAPGGESGRAAAQAVLAGVATAAQTKAPWRCAHAPIERLALPPGDGAIAIGVVADARGASDDTLASLAAIHASFAQAHVRLVLADGGMGTTQPELERTLGAIVDPAWTVVAIPGATESVPALRGAIASLKQKGAAIADGSAARAIDLGGVDVAIAPGVAFASELAAGADGCTRDRADLDAAVASLGGSGVRSKPAVRILVSATAPRTRTASDLAPGGVHAGELDLAAALANAPIDLVVHPQVGAPSAAGSISANPPWPRATVAAGIADARPRFDDRGARLPPGALVIVSDRSGIRWQPVP